MRLPRVLAVVICCMYAGHAVGADLVEYQRLAVQHRPVVERFQSNLEVGETQRAVARGAYLPSVDVGYTVTVLDEKQTFEDDLNSVAVGAVTWNLFRGFRDRSGVDLADRLRDVEEHRLHGIHQDLGLEVALRYLAIYTRLAALEVTEDAYATLQKLHTDAENRYAVGLIKRNDVLKFKVDLDHAQISTRRAETEVAKSVRRLERSVGAPVARSQLAFTEFEALPARGDYAALEARMLEVRSELLALRQLEAAARAQIGQVRADYYPAVDLSLSYRSYDDEVINRGPDAVQDEIRGQVTVSMNLFDGNRKRHNLSRAELEGRSLRLDRSEMESELRTLLRNLIYDYDVSVENAGVALASIEQAEENLRITRASYREGLATESDLLDATANLTRARSNYVAAKSEVFATHFHITRAVEGFEL